MKKSVLSLLFFFCAHISYAQLEITNITTENSFLGEWIKDAFKDSAGNMWFADATGNGIYKFNGKKWINYDGTSSLSDFVTAFAEDEDGYIWIAAYDGVYRFKEPDDVTKYTTTEGLPSNSINDIVVDNLNRVWVATYEGIAVLNGSTWNSYDDTDGMVSKFATCLFVDNLGRLWIGTEEGASKLDGGFTNYTDADGLPEIRITVIIQTTDSSIWFGTNGTGAASLKDDVWTYYTTDDGLSRNKVSDIFQDSNGNIWFTSYLPNGGLTKYDGITWPTYQPEHGLIHDYTDCVAEDDEGNIWIGTAHGISKLQPESWKYLTIADGLPGIAVYDITSDSSGNKWFATINGVSEYNGIFTNYSVIDGLPHDICNSIETSPDDKIWVGTQNGAAVKTESGWDIFNSDSGLVNNIVTDISFDDGSIWFATLGGVSIFNGSEWTSYTTGNGLVDNESTCSLIDNEGNAWIGSLNGGVSKFDGFVWTEISTNNHLPNNVIRDIYQDSKDNIWIGTDGGVTRYDGLNWDTFIKDDGLATNSVRSIGEDDYGRIWFGSDSSMITIYNGSDFIIYSALSAIPNVITTAITEINDTIYATSIVGVVLYSYKTAWTNYHQSAMTGNTIECAIVDNSDNLWIGTWGQGVGKYDGASWNNFSTTEGLSGNNVYGLAQDDSSYIWVASSSAGLSKITSDTVLSYDSGDGLPGTGCYSVDSDNEGNIWIGTNAGLSKFDGSTFENYTTLDGLPGNHVKTIHCSETGDIWIGTTAGNGAARFNGVDWDIFRTSEGLLNNNIEDILEDDEGKIWIATYGGISVYDGDSFTNYSSSGYFSNAAIWSLTSDQMGNIWCGTWGFGAFMFNGEFWTNLSTSEGIAGNDVREVVEMKDGSIWLATYGNGLSKIERQLFSVLNVEYENPSCTNTNDGSIVIITNIHENLQYSVGTGFLTSGTFNNLHEGDYLPVVTNGFDTIRLNTINLIAASQIIVDLGNDTAICPDEVLTINSGFTVPFTFEWSTGSTDEEIVIEGAGTYQVTVTNTEGCTDSDEINVTLNPAPDVNLGEDMLITTDDVTVLDAGEGYSAYEWSTEETTSAISVDGTVLGEGVYTFSVTVTNEFLCQSTDEIQVTINEPAGISDNENDVILPGIYPNPAGNLIYIDFNTSVFNVDHLEIVDIMGNSLKVSVPDSLNKLLRLDLTEISPGIYYIIYYDENGKVQFDSFIRY
ncbi:MAG: T9SS type A sorting domain-containing protein [Bacteroidales bacterium]|nr:T9SS type A sorting domain-containing protein [Bacteroidales bacterium]